MTDQSSSSRKSNGGQTALCEDGVVRVEYGDEPHQLSHRSSDWTCVVCGSSEGVAGWPRKCREHLHVPTRYVGDRQRNAVDGVTTGRRCPVCGHPVPPARRHRGGGSRPRIYCSNACRQAAYRDRAG